MSNLAEFNYNPNCDIKKEVEEIVVKDELYRGLANKANESIYKEGIFKFDEPFEQLTSKHRTENACLQQKTSEIFPTLEQPWVINALLIPHLQSNVSTVSNLIKQEDNVVCTNLHDICPVNMYSKPSNVKDFQVKVQLQKSNVVCHVSSYTATFAEEDPPKPGQCEQLSLKNDDMTKSIIQESHAHCTMQKHTVVLQGRPGNLEKSIQCRWCLYKGVPKQTPVKHMFCVHNENKCEMCKYQPMKTNIQCNICEYSTNNKSPLVGHNGINTDDKPFKCEVCNYSTSHKPNFKQHLRTHTGERPFKCEVCKYSASLKGTLLQHIRTHTGEKLFKCKLCDYSASRKYALVLHNYSHTGENLFKCELCHYSTSHKCSIKRHIQTHTVKPLICKLCDYSALDKRSLVLHMRTHNVVRPFKCELCDYRAMHKSNLTVHIRIHTGDKPFKCELCDYSASRKSYLVQHMRTHTGEKSFKCELCDLSVSRKDNLKKHMRTHTGERPFKCGLCDYSAVVKCNLVLHMQTHTS